MRRMTKAVLLLSASLAASGAQAAPNLIVNGGFESPVAPTSPGYATFSFGGLATIPGWTVTAGDVDIVSPTFNGGPNPASVGQWLDLVGFAPNSSISSQSFATTVGKFYKLTFQYGANGGTRTANLSVGNLSDTITSSTGYTFLPYSKVFKATSGTSILSFADVGGSGNGGVALDAVSVTATPEPEAWASMVLGLGLAGWVARRRRRQTVAA